MESFWCKVLHEVAAYIPLQSQELNLGVHRVASSMWGLRERVFDCHQRISEKCAVSY